jgi:hypothetical protein
MGVINTVGVAHVVTSNWNGWSGPVEHSFNSRIAPGTYMVVFGAGQGLQLKIFQKAAEKKNSRITVHYEAPQAINRKPGHGQTPRNTLILFTKS